MQLLSRPVCDIHGIEFTNYSFIEYYLSATTFQANPFPVEILQKS